MTTRSDLSDMENLLKLLNASDAPFDDNGRVNSTEQPEKTADAAAELARSAAAAIEEFVDGSKENRFAIHVVQGMMKSKAKGT